MTLTGRVLDWARSGTEIQIEGNGIFLRQVDGAGPTLVFLHGYPSSSYDWRYLLPLLPGRRILMFDFLGFGLSAKPRLARYSLLDQADLAERLIERSVEGPVLLVAHDMGTSVVTELLARDIEGHLSFGIAGALLFNGSMVLDKANLTPAQKVLRSRLGPVLARLSNAALFRAQFSRVFSPDHPLSRDEAEDQWSLLAHRGGARMLDRLTYYLHERVTYAARWHGALHDWPGRLELAWAGRDPVCVAAVLQAVLDLRPSAPLSRWPTLGHYPQLEDPGAVARTIAEFAER